MGQLHQLIYNPDPGRSKWQLGIWSARTSDTHKTVNCPINAKIAFWVGLERQVNGYFFSKPALNVKIN